MTLYADLHIHSKYARATSISMDLEHLEQGAKEKGLGLIGTGDFTHPKWFAELKQKLEPDSERNGFFALKNSASPARFMLQVEVATFKSTPKKVRKVHHVICVPSIEEAAQLIDVYSKWGNLVADGRPMFGSRSSAELVEKTMQAVPNAVVFPAHIWTPYFGALGSESGFDSIQEAYEDQSKHVFCYETGMSADPAMCWRVSSLDAFTPVSFSDSHSHWPWRLGRECTAFSDDVRSFTQLWDAVRRKDRKKMLFTIETDPAYGKYHWDGHRACNFSCPPEESRKINRICPKCNSRLTIGVEYRVEELADRPQGFTPSEAIPFKKLLPLHELFSAAYATSLSSKKVMTDGNALVRRFGSELAVLLDAQKQALDEATNEKITQAILLNREGRIFVQPGYDGEYGVPQLPRAAMIAESKENNADKTLSATVKTETAVQPQIRQKRLKDW
ncbi:hypothetical protein AUJ65_01225 [Candidatus Micrarchaeota archaeon CG1_02_51_15]|nr:MAG: hypothetical protein AUJ65_01225 [Candidatus Micrarchaeota archaeon CG1_02_51_15]